MDNVKIAVVGSGMIGSGLAVNALAKGITTVVYDILDTDKIRNNLEHVVDIMTEAGALSDSQANEIRKNALFTNKLQDALVDTVFVQECVPEKIDLKRSIYRQIQEICGPDVLIASSTSAIMPSVLQEGALYPENIVVGHPYYPSYLLPLVEVCGGDVPENTVKKVLEIYKAMGKVPIYCRKEVPGFIVNRLSWNAMDIAKEIVAAGVCTVEDMDKAIMFGPGMRMAVTGQILSMSLGIQGGIRAAAEKYGRKLSEADLICADGVDKEIENRPVKWGNTVEEVEKHRDRVFTAILKAQDML